LLREAQGLPPDPEAEPSAPRVAGAPEVVSGPAAVALPSTPDLGADRVNAPSSDPVTAEAQVYQLPPRPRPRWPLLLVAAAVAAAAIGTGVTIARNDPPPPPPKDLPAPNPTEPERPTQEVANAVRNDARRDCDEGRWEACREKLDNAQALDPQGDQSPTVQRMRAGIAKALTPVPESADAGTGKAAH
jgi:hypothetical protein